MADTLTNSALPIRHQTTPREKPVVIGIYGVPGCGKSFLLNELKMMMAEEHFAFYDGSKMIDSVVPGGLKAFLACDEHAQMKWRQHAIEKIGDECARSGDTGVVAGHLIFWAKDEEIGKTVWTTGDLNTFTHILYLDVDAELVSKRRSDDASRDRPHVSIDRLRKWQQAEKDQLRSLCLDHGILFSAVSSHATMALYPVVALLRDFRRHNERENLLLAQSKLNQIFGNLGDRLETVLMLDADKTLAGEDTGDLFWEKASRIQQTSGEDQPLDRLFSSPLKYSYTAFRQATLLYEEKTDEGVFETICRDVASAVNMHSDFVDLLKQAAQKEHVGAVVVTSGLRRVWELVLEKEGLSNVKVIGGGRISDGFVVNAQVKAALLTHLQDVYGTYIWAFGDSPLDLDMLSKADEAVVVVGEDQKRSRSMDAALLDAIDNHGLQARQVLLPSKASPRLDSIKLPVVQLTDRSFIDAVFNRRNPRKSGQIQHATDKNAAKLLMSATRDASIAGVALRDAHRRIGWYLATEFLTQMIGMEEYDIPHVQGHKTTGYRVAHEEQTTIVAVMRGGEPMAYGVSEALPLAMFVHAKFAEELKDHHLQGKRTIVLVDSVINSGKSVVEFEKHIRKMNTEVRVVVIAGVTQEKSITQGSLSEALAHDAKFSLITLRLSENKFTGKGTTDTGNRLFNTTELD